MTPTSKTVRRGDAPERITPAAARRMALAAQGFGGSRDDVVGMRQFQQDITRLGQFQIDSVNVCVRAHLMPTYSRHGAYDVGLLERAAGHRPRRLFEFWGHAASYIDVTLQPALRWRAERAQSEAWGSMRRIAAEQPDLIEHVLERVQAGPVTARQLASDLVRPTGNWGWNWTNEKKALEWLFWIGAITSAGRTSQFERIYDIPQRVFPAQILAQPTPASADAMRQLVLLAARALGVASTRSLADYFRLPVAAARQAVAELAEQSELLPVIVGDQLAWRWRDARRPRQITGEALVSPFDSLVFERTRLERLFGIHYRIGIYTPAAMRTEGYYVYLFVCDDEIAARVDLKADRRRGVLQVQGAWRDSAREDLVPRLRSELDRMADWLGLDEVQVADVGDLAAALRQR